VAVVQPLLCLAMSQSLAEEKRQAEVQPLFCLALSQTRCDVGVNGLGHHDIMTHASAGRRELWQKRGVRQWCV
jgi:hypothetical protein